MKRATVLAYLCIPALLTLGTFVVALRREPFGPEMFAAVVLGGYLFYAAPHLLWVFIGALVGLSNAIWHAGLIAASIALAAIAALWLGPGDPSGLPMQWLLYWPLAVVLQIVVAVLTALYRRARAPNSALLTDTYTSPLRAQHGAAKRERSVARGNTVSANLLTAHDPDESPEAYAGDCLRPRPVLQA